MKKNRFFPLFFLLYFSFYVISPLSYSVDSKQLAEKPLTFQGIRLFAAELILSTLTHNKGSDENKENSSSAQHVLLKKKRSTVSTVKPTLSKNQFQIITLPGPGVVSSSLTAIPSFVRSDHVQINRGFHSPYSGLSPPFVLQATL